MENQRVFLSFLRQTDKMVFKRALNFGDPQTINTGQSCVVEEHQWKSISSLALCCGFYTPYPRNTVELLKQVTQHYTSYKVVFVCCHNELGMYNNPQNSVPAGWAFCVSVEQLERELQENLEPAQRTLIVQRMLPQPPPPPPSPVQMQRGNRFSVNIGGQFDLLSSISIIMEAYDHEQGDIQHILDESVQLAEQQQQQEIRKRKRREHKWDRLLKDPVPVENDNEDPSKVCVVCMENYACIQFVDEAGLCDHVVMCDSCAGIIMDDTRKCPVCRAYALTIRRKEINE